MLNKWPHRNKNLLYYFIWTAQIIDNPRSDPSRVVKWYYNYLYIGARHLNERTVYKCVFFFLRKSLLIKNIFKIEILKNKVKSYFKIFSHPKLYYAIMRSKNAKWWRFSTKKKKRWWGGWSSSASFPYPRVLNFKEFKIDYCWYMN